MEIQEIVLAGVKLEHPIMNAAGTCKSLSGDEGVEGLVKTMTSAVVVGSITKEFRSGNEGNPYYFDEQRLHSINSLGLPNPGIQYWEENLPVAVKMCHAVGKPLIMSVAGFNAGEFALLAEKAFTGGADIVELNLGCPNVLIGGAQKGIISFNPDLVTEILQDVSGEVGPDANVLVKFSPVSDPYLLKRLFGICNRFSVVKGVVNINTYPNGFAFNGDKPAIAPNNGLGGIGGPVLKPLALGQIRQAKSILHRDTQILGVGGIWTGQDIKDYLQSGASAVQIASAFIQRKGEVFNILLDEYLALLD